MSEESIAKEIGAKLVKNSGRNLKKGDMILEKYDLTFLIDAKEGASLNLNSKVWTKVCTDSYTYGPQYIPMILRALNDGTMIACIPFSELMQIIEERELNNGE